MADSNNTNQQNSNVKAPQMYFKLTSLSKEDLKEEISRMTNNFSQDYNIKPEFIEEFNQLINQIDKPLFRGYVNTPKNDTNGDIMKQVIGKDGCYFHLTTNNTKSMFIWHERGHKKVYVWGEKFPVINSLKVINKRIQLVLQRQLAN